MWHPAVVIQHQDHRLAAHIPGGDVHTSGSPANTAPWSPCGTTYMTGLVLSRRQGQQEAKRGPRRHRAQTKVFECAAQAWRYLAPDEKAGQGRAAARDACIREG